MKYEKRLFIALLFTLLLFSLSHDLFAAQNFSIFPNGEKPSGLIFTISLFSGLISALAVHELGHLLTGLAQGFRFELFVVFLFGIKRTAKGIRLFLNRDFGYMGGVAATVPVRNDSRNRRKFANMMLAGPVASLLFAVICFLFLVYTRNVFWSFWLMACATSIGLFFATTIPSKTGIFFTDRARFQRLISTGQAGKSEEALLQLIAQTMIDNSCKYISIDNARILQSDKEAFMRFWGHYYGYEYYRSNQQIAHADTAKLRLLDLKVEISKPIWNAMKIEE